MVSVKPAGKVIWLVKKSTKNYLKIKNEIDDKVMIGTPSNLFLLGQSKFFVESSNEYFSL